MYSTLYSCWANRYSQLSFSLIYPHSRAMSNEVLTYCIAGAILSAMSKFTANTIFQSSARLYTNFHSGEHGELKVLSGIKTTVAETLAGMPKYLTDDAFVEAVLSGASADSDHSTTREKLGWKVNAKHLTKENAKWVLKLFKSPHYFIKSIAGAYDETGRLCLDLRADLTLATGVLIRVFSTITDDTDYLQKKTFLHATYNVVSAVKFMFMRYLSKGLRTHPGIGIDSINDVYSVEVCAIDHRQEFERVVSDVNETEKFQEVFELATDKLF